MKRPHLFRAVSALAMLAVTLRPRAAFAKPMGPADATVAVEEPRPIAIPPARVARARAWLGALQAGTIERSQMNPLMNAILSDDGLKLGCASVRALGEPRAMLPFEERSTADGLASYYRVRFADRTLTYVFSVGYDGLIDGFILRARPRDTLFSVVVRDVGDRY